jgi:DNA topoisomerase IA
VVGKTNNECGPKLYEKGLISYHRTDSVYLSEKAIGEFRKYIGTEYGENYLSEKVRVIKIIVKMLRRRMRLSGQQMYQSVTLGS